MDWAHRGDAAAALLRYDNGVDRGYEPESACHC